MDNKWDDTHPMDMWDSILVEPEDWAELKNIAKNLRYAHLKKFLEVYSKYKIGNSKKWFRRQLNFTVEVGGSIKTDDFESRLAGLGVNELKV